MEFMHPDEHEAYPVLEVPFLGIEYEGSEHLSFAEWPDSHGFNSILALQGSFPELAPANIEPLVQAWLYLGLLAEVLNQALGNNVALEETTRLTSKHFISDSESSNVQVVTTSGLEKHLNAWKTRAENLDPATKEEDETYILHCLLVARTFARSALRPRPESSQFSFSPIIQSSLVVLGSTLENYASLIYNRSASSWPPSLIALERLSEMCENERDWLISQFSSECIWYRSTLAWPEDRKDHSKCSKRVCVGNNIDTDNYKTLHLTESCKCSFVRLDELRVVDSLRQNRIPLVSIDMKEENCSIMSVETVDNTTHTDYVAISHVWSDGLGNPYHNSLPHCRLENLAQMVSMLLNQPRALLWIDTLCVPQNVPERRRAIAKMKETFEQAKSVLVLDAQLQRTCMDFGYRGKVLCSGLTDTLRMETLLRITLCGWMRRLWTFQEAAVSTELDFRFADGTINLRELLLSARDIKKPLVYQTYTQLMILRSLRYDLDLKLQIGLFLNALKWRTTSKAEDEAICIAAMFNLSPERFVDLPIEKHMPQLLASIGTIPVGLLFSKGPKLSTTSFTWAPSSFLNAQNQLDLTLDSSSDFALGLVDDSGLSVKLSGWTTVHGNIKPEGKIWWIEETEATKTTAAPTLMQVFKADDNDKIVNWESSDFTAYSEVPMGLVVKAPLPTVLPTGTTDFFKGVCVAILDDASGKLTAKILCRVVVAICDYAELLTDLVIHPTSVHRLHETQEWRFI